MPAQVVFLEDAFEQILDAAVDVLIEEARIGKPLEGVRQVQRGDRDAAPDVPYIQIYAEPALVSQAHALREVWTLPLVLLIGVEDNDPVEGYTRAQHYASKARRILKDDRRLGLTFVQDAQSARLEASAPWSKQGTRYEALAVVNIIFTVYEP